MLGRILRRTLRLGAGMGHLVASAAGCFVFTRGFQLIEEDGEESKMVSPSRAAGRSPKPLAGMEAPLFLIASIASEGPMTKIAFRL